MTNNVYELNLTAAAALSRAARSAGVDIRDVADEEITLRRGCYEIRFSDRWMRYDCFVDAATGEVPGVCAMPLGAA